MRTTKKDIFTILKETCGIAYSHWAKRLGLTAEAFDYARKRGFTKREREILEDAAQESATKLSHFAVPDTSKKNLTKVD